MTAMRCTSVLVLSFSLLAVVPAHTQVTPHLRTLPKVLTGVANSPTGANIFSGRSRCLFQCWFDGSNLRAGIVTSLGLKENRTAGTLQHKLEIVMSSSTAGFTMSQTFAQNLGATPTTFFTMKTISLPAVNTVGPNQSGTWFAGDRPFIFSGPNLIIQWDIQTSTSFGTLGTRTMDGLYQTSTVPLNGTIGTSCGAASLTSSYDTSSSSLVYTANNLQPSTPTILLLGFDSAFFAGAIRLPFDLGPLGFTGCTLDVDPIFTFVMAPVTTTASRVSLPIPVPAGSTYPIHAQAMFTDASKPSGFGTSNATWSMIGNVGLVNYMYNWSRDGATAQYGPYAVNSTVTHFLKP